jgi:hypothetical protein
MRRSFLVLTFVIAVGGLVLAFTLPSRTVPDCPPPGSPSKCIYMTDVRPWVRFAVGTVAVLPAVILIGARLRPSRKFASAMMIAGTTVAVVLWWIGGPVPATNGDCVAYPRCYTTGHVYGGPAFLILLITAAIGFWLWPHEPWDERARRSHVSHPTA